MYRSMCLQHLFLLLWVKPFYSVELVNCWCTAYGNVFRSGTTTQDVALAFCNSPFVCSLSCSLEFIKFVSQRGELDLVSFLKLSCRRFSRIERTIFKLQLFGLLAQKSWFLASICQFISACSLWWQAQKPAKRWNEQILIWHRSNRTDPNCYQSNKPTLIDTNQIKHEWKRTQTSTRSTGGL